MANTHRPHPLDSAIEQYVANRHALGRRFLIEERTLLHLRRFLARAGAHELTESLFDQWRFRSHRLSNSTHVREEGIVSRFCRYRRRTDPRVFLPDPYSLTRLKPYAPPMILTRAQVARLLALCAARPYIPSYALPQAVMRIAIVLLYTAGLRRGELVRLTLADVDARAGVLWIRDSKFRKSRWIPLSRGATRELRRFLRTRRRAGLDPSPQAPLLMSLRGRGYEGCVFGTRFAAICARAGVRSEVGRCPRVHDMRHTFAVHALLRCYEAGGDAQAMLPRLALYMGHVSIASTAYYLRLMPAVLERASRRFAGAFDFLTLETMP